MPKEMGGEGAPNKPDDEIKVTIHLIGAKKPFELGVPPSATIGSIKQAALNEFGVAEGPTPDGKDIITFTLFEGKTKLEDPNQTIGAVAGHAHSVNLKLVKKIIQG